jgi:hypothetical protein
LRFVVLLLWWKEMVALETHPFNKRLELSGSFLFCFPSPCWPAVAARSREKEAVPQAFPFF